MSITHPDSVTLEKGFAALPLATYEAGEIVLAAGSKTGRLLFLRKGAAAVIRDGIEIARVSEPGAVFGEISALLDQPHSADVRAVENFPVSRRECGHSARPGHALLRCGGPGTSS